MTGSAIGMIFDARSGKVPSFFRSLLAALRRFAALLLLGIIVFAISFFVGRLLRGAHAVVLYLVYLFLIFVQIILLYAMISVIIDKKSILKAMQRSFAVTKTKLLPMFIIVGASAILYLPIFYL